MIPARPPTSCSAAVMLVCQSTSVPNTSKAMTSTSTAVAFPAAAPATSAAGRSGKPHLD